LLKRHRCQKFRRAYLELGNIALIEGKLDEAEKDYSAILKLLSASEEQKKKAIYKLGKVKFYQGNFDEARVICHKFSKSKR